ncbi:unnamed protein product [Orchesella dallaii]|uniref:F-box domain-containing protein n=1 Tax=Orchesella dallaii TaxID=48710 RepID=A0ABP1SAZ8_9HEXA
MEIQGIREHKNPMLNHVVLERIFQLAEFDTKSFANYRLVCKEWYESSLQTWRKKGWISITTCHQHHGVHVEDFLQLLKSPEHRFAARPFHKYIINQWRGAIHDKDGESENPAILQFWKAVGPLMTHLNLKSSHFYFNDNFRKVIFELTPNLKSLAVGEIVYIRRDDLFHVYDFDPQQKGLKVCQHLTELKVNLVEFESCPMMWKELLWHFPNMEIFEATRRAPGPFHWFLCELLEIFEHLRNTVGSHYFKNLSELHLLQLDTFTPELALVLQRLQFPLKVLTFGFGSERGIKRAKKMLRLVLKTHAQTLEELILVREEECGPYEDFPFGIQFPKLTKFRSSGKLVNNFKFVQHMPNLEYLFLEQEGHRIQLNKVGWRNSVVNLNLTEFKLTDKFCTGRELKFLGKLMPNLTKISLGLRNKECFKSLCSIWKDVTDLNIYSRDSDEDAYWKSKEGDKFMKENIDNLIELRSLKVGKLVEYPECML